MKYYGHVPIKGTIIPDEQPIYVPPEVVGEPEEDNSGASWHGTVYGYKQRGCRCQLCREANTRKNRERREKRKAKERELNGKTDNGENDS